MSIPKVYSAITAVIADLSAAGIPKRRINLDEQYTYRGIDDIYDRLSPLLAANRLCILPRVLERICTDRSGSQGELLVNVSIKAAFHLVSAQDGSTHVIESFGEALDAGDKATSKAMTAAYKYAIFQTFCIPVGGIEDGDAHSHRLKKSQDIAEPVQGWNQWTGDVCEMLRVCQTPEAIDRVQERNRSLFEALRRERPELYTSLGEVVLKRRQEVAAPARAAPSKRAIRPAPQPKQAPKRTADKREKMDA